METGAWGGVVVKALRYSSDGPGIDSRWYHWIFYWYSFRLHHGPGVDSAPSENEYQEHFMGVKAAGNEMGGTRGAYAGEERGAQGFGVETWGKETIGETQTQMGG